MAATLLAFLPGFVFPFVATLELDVTASAAILLAYSLAVAVNGTVGGAIEVSAIASVGPHISNHTFPTGKSLARLCARNMLLSTAVVLILAPMMVFFVFDRFDDPPSVYSALIGLLPLPALYAACNTLSGALIATGATPLAIASQAFRALPAILILVSAGAPSIIQVATGFALGECGRIFFLLIALKRNEVVGECAAVSVRLSSRGTLWQASSSLVSQLGPLVSRSFFVAAGPAALLAFELGDRISAAGNQFLASGVVLPRLSEWSRAQDNKSSLRRRVFGDAKRIVLLSSVISIVASLLLVALATVDLFPSSWESGFRWGAVLVLSLPAAVFSWLANRVLVLISRQRLLMPLMLIGLGLTVSLNFVFFHLSGGIGVLVSIVVARFALAGASLYVMVVQLNRAVSEDAAERALQR